MKLFSTSPHSLIFTISSSLTLDSNSSFLQKLVMDLPNAELDLNDAELEEFLIERGMTAEGLTREQQLKWASDWLTMAKDPSIVPSVYLLFAAANTHGKIPNHSQLAISDAL